MLDFPLIIAVLCTKRILCICIKFDFTNESREDILFTDIQQRQHLRFDGFTVFLCQNINAGLQLQPVIYLVSLKHFHCLVIQHGIDAVHIMLNVRQSAFLCLLKPFLAVAILGKQNTGMLAQNITADVQGLLVDIVNVFILLQSVGNTAQ